MLIVLQNKIQTNFFVKKNPENFIQQPVSSRKEQNKSEIKKEKTLSEIKNEKIGSKSSTKSLSNINADNNENVLMPKMDKDNHDSKKKYIIPELAVLEQLFTEYGFDKVLDSLYKPNLGNNKLDLCV